MKRLAVAASFCLALAGALAPGAFAQTRLAQQEPQAEGCPRLIASRAPRVVPASLARDELRITFVGHATFLIETPRGLRAATDFNDYVRPPTLPDVATMNRAHSTHFTQHPDPGIRHVLRGWNPAGGPAAHDLIVEDMRIRNVVTNIRDWRGGTDYDGNSIFVFEAAEICVAHLGHLHHALTPEHIKALGRIDVALVPVDGGYTMSMEDMLSAVEQMGVQVIIPMHFFSQMTLKRFIDRAAERYPVEMSSAPSIVLSRDKLPVRTKVVVLPGR
ncbi:MAG: hypothetical protein JWN93_356 [Hyphomicrobiales bacterium]|nr:hypothetical protein [Hyphomicrobiales bacterium]